MATASEILSVDPDLVRGVPSRLRPAARRACLAGTRRIPRGEWRPWGEQPDPGGFGLLVVSGHLVRRVGRGERFGAELLGPGDLLRPWQTIGSAASLPFEPRWSAITPVELAILDADFARRAAPFPAIAIQLVDRATLRSRHLAVAIAIVQQPRIEDRLLRLFWSYADRWGTVGTEGVSIEVPLTHGLLAELAAAQRPTVSTALGRMARSGLVERVDEGWLLRGGPPLEEVRSGRRSDL